MSTPQEREDLVANTEFLTAQMDLYTRMASRCWDKCITKHWEADLTVGESTCAQRCARKYMQVNRMVTKSLLGAENYQKREDERHRIVLKMKQDTP